MRGATKDDISGKKLKMWLFWLIVLYTTVIATRAARIDQSGPAAEKSDLVLPFGSVKRITSIDGLHTLYGVAGTELWIENARTGQHRMVLSTSGTLRAKWSPSGATFSINDNRSSDSTLAYIYNARTLKRTNIAQEIRAADPRARRLLRNAHAYFVVERWDRAQNALIHLSGHTDDSPVACFDLRYRFSPSGTIRKLSEHVGTALAQFCR